MKKFLQFLLVLLACHAVRAQDVVLTGRVATATGEALPGVNVLVKGTNVGTMTDANGSFKIAVGNATLVFSFIGYRTVELTTNGRTSLDVTMEEDVTTLEQIIVVGYGVQEKKDITGAVSVVNSEALESRPNSQFGNLIQGKTSGVQILSSSGKPSAGFNIRIRGTNSINGNSEPLYVVDGIPITDTRTINPSDIESFTILKDASSAAIYGAQGANGVVLITTRRGKAGTPHFEFSAYTGFTSAWRKLKVLNSEQYRDLMTELWQSTDWSQYTANTDWQNEIFQNGRSQNYQLSLSGKNENTSYYMSAGWTQQIGAIRSSEMDRYNFKTNLEQKVNNWLTIGTNISYMRYHDVDVADNQAINQGGVILGMLSTPSNIGIYNADGTFTRNPFQDWENPVSSTDGSERGYNNNRVLGSLYAEMNVLKDLKFKTNIGIDYSNGIYDYFLDPFRTGYGRAKKGIAQNNTNISSYYIIDNTLTYQKSFADIHKVSALVGSVLQETRWADNSIETNGFSGNAVPTTNAGSIIVSANNSKREKSNASFLGRVTYDYSDKYLLTANFRADASSTFGPSNRWGYFPSFSLGWRLSEELFMSSVTFVDDLKLRLGWGIVGNEVGNNAYPWVGSVSAGANYPIGGVIQPGNYQSSIENSDLKWEETQQTNIGLDVAVLNSRVVITAEAYLKNTYDLLFYLPIPRSTGFDSGIQNVSKMENRGLEFMVTSQNLVGALKWETDFNISFNRNKIIDINNQDIYSAGVAGRGEVSLSTEGKPLGLFFGYVAGGVDPLTGNVYYIDADGESTFSPATTDRTVIGNPNPDFIYGMTNTLSYKNFNFSVFLQGTQGNDIFNATRVETEGMIDVKNQSSVVNNRWRQPGDVTDIPRASFGNINNSRASTRFVEDGSYLRVKALTLSYNVPPALLSRINVGSVKVYATGENLFTFTKYKGYDPEVNAFGGSNTALGVDYGTYPQTRNLILGLNVTF
jgi:TonB-linked SusC/RagA family outer membrane protein